MTTAVAPPRLTLAIGGRAQEVTLREAETREIVPLYLDPDLRVPDLVRSRRVLEMLALVDTIDGEIPDEPEAEAIIAEPALLAAVLQARDAFYDRLVEQGRALAACPHCRAGEVELDLLFYWVALRLPAWRLSDEDGLLGRPSLASTLPPGARPAGLAATRRLSFRYGSDIRGRLLGLRGPDAPMREAAAWRHHVPAGVEPEDERAHWRETSTGFRAILRLSVALAWPDGRDATPAEVDVLPVGAFFFLDLLHFATCNLDIPDAARLAVRCPSCGGDFLPVLGDDTAG